MNKPLYFTLTTLYLLLPPTQPWPCLMASFLRNFILTVLGKSSHSEAFSFWFWNSLPLPIRTFAKLDLPPPVGPIMTNLGQGNLKNSQWCISHFFLFPPYFPLFNTISPHSVACQHYQALTLHVLKQLLRTYFVQSQPSKSKIRADNIIWWREWSLKVLNCNVQLCLYIIYLSNLMWQSLHTLSLVYQLSNWLPTV